VTREGEDILLPVEENTADFITATEEEMASAITKSIHNVMAVVSGQSILNGTNLIVKVRAVRKLKRLTFGRAKSPPSSSSIPTGSLSNSDIPSRPQTVPLDNGGRHHQQLRVSEVAGLESPGPSIPTVKQEYLARQTLPTAAPSGSNSDAS
jgi:[calcium/calmodulin-dependent protein kinase] kinase